MINFFKNLFNRAKKVEVEKVIETLSVDDWSNNIPIEERWHDLPKYQKPASPIPHISDRIIGYPTTKEFIELRTRCIEAAARNQKTDVIASAKEYLKWIMEEYTKPDLP